MANSAFEEQAYRTLLANLRLWLEEELHNIRLGRIQPNSRPAEKVQLLGEVYDHFHDLVMNVVLGQAIDAMLRQAYQRLRIQNAFLRREVAYYRGSLIQEQALSSAFYDFALERLLNKKQEGVCS